MGCANDFGPIEHGCGCSTCATYTRAVLHTVVAKESTAASLITVHNLHFMMTLLHEMREAIGAGTLPSWIRKFLTELFPTAKPSPCAHCPPRWVRSALASVNIETDDLFDWSDGTQELADMPHH